MLCLNEKYIISQGRLRVCYQHPHDPGLVIKLPGGDSKKELQANLKEYRGYHALLSRHGELPFVLRCHGFVSTNIGDGLVCDCLRDADGGISQTIYDLFESGGSYDIEQIIALAEEFCAFLQKWDVWLFDLNLKNLALQVQDDFSYKLYVVDVKGRFDNNEFIKFASYFEWFARKKVRRRCDNLLKRLSFYC